jgi:DNA repair exonuclease SbcCD ATPase subunit
MIMKSTLKTMSLTTALLATVLFNSPRPVLAAPAQEVASNFATEDAMTAELKQLASLLRQLDNNADRLNSLAPNNHRWQTHSYHLNEIKDQVNRIGDRLEALQAMQSFALPWQLEAIDSVVPMGLQIADRTTAAINHLNENHQYLWAPHYVDHLRTIASLADQMEGRLDTHLKLDEARDKIQTLGEKLAEEVS